jgi:hypothetical protein
MNRFVLCLSVLLFIATASASDYENVKVVRYNKADSLMVIEVEGQQHQIKIDPACMIWDESGKRVSYVNGKKLMPSAQRVTVKAVPHNADPKLEIAQEVHINPGKENAKPADTTPPSRSASKKGASGGLNRNVEKLDLRPDPNFNDKLADVAVPSHLLRWFPSGKVGDFVEQSKGKNGWARYELVAIEGNAAIIATVVQIETVKQELRVRMKLAPDQQKFAGINAKLPPGKVSGTENITVGDRTLKCTVIKDGKATTWYCPDVPLDGIVKKDTVNGNTMLLDFGKGN